MALMVDMVQLIIIKHYQNIIPENTNKRLKIFLLQFEWTQNQIGIFVMNQFAFQIFDKQRLWFPLRKQELEDGMPYAKLG